MENNKQLFNEALEFLKGHESTKDWMEGRQKDYMMDVPCMVATAMADFNDKKKEPYGEYILIATLESQLKIEEAAYKTLSETYKLENHAHWSLIKVTDSKIEEIKKQLHELNNKYRGD